MNRFILVVGIVISTHLAGNAQCNDQASLIGLEVAFDFSGFDFNKAFQEDVLANLPSGWQEPNGAKKGRYRYSLSGPLHVKFVNDQNYPIQISSRLRFVLKAGTWVSFLWKDGYVDVEASGDLIIKAKVGVTLDGNYHLVPSIDFTQFDMRNAGIAEFLFDLAKDEIVRLLKSLITTHIDRWINPSPKLDEVWTKITTPINAENGYYLHVNPQYWGLNNIYGDAANDKILKFAIGMQASPQINNSAIHVERKKPVIFGLPNNVTLGNTWCINMQALSEYSSVNSLIEKEFAGKPVSAKVKLSKKRFKKYLITGTSIKGVDKGTVEMTVQYKKKPSAKKTRTLIYTSKPVVDVPSQTLILTELKNRKTPRSIEQFVLAVATLFQRDFRMPLNDKIDTAKSNLNASLQSQISNVVLNGSVNNLKFIGVTVEETQITLHANATGTMSATTFFNN